MASQARACPHCGGLAETHQSICLECGEQLPHRRVPGGWLLPAAAALGVAAVAGAVVLAIGKDDGPRSIVAPPLTTVAATAGPPPATAPSASPAGVSGTVAGPPAATTGPAAGTTGAPGATTVTPATTGAPGATTVTPATTAAATTTTAPATTTFRPAAPPLTAWPAERDGFTVVLASLPKERGSGPAQARARDAALRGLAETGVLDSDEIASLHPGYFVVFSGVYATLAEAQQAATAARDRFPGAYSRRIAR